MSNEIQPPDCLVRAQQLLAEADLIRAELGRSRDARPLPTITGAEPREVYFGALALFRKADRLGLELAGDQLDELPEAPAIDKVAPKDVLAVLDAAHGEITNVKARLGISKNAEVPARDASKTPSDVLQAVIAVNRQLNLLLENPFTPSDVYEQVSWASLYAGRLLKAKGAAASTSPEYQRGKRPSDCYDRLLGCLDLVRAALKSGGKSALEISARGETDAVPGDVFDLASLVLAEVAYLHGTTSGVTAPYPFEVQSASRRVPSHCYQRIGLLEAQLAQLAKG